MEAMLHNKLYNSLHIRYERKLMHTFITASNMLSPVPITWFSQLCKPHSFQKQIIFVWLYWVTELHLFLAATSAHQGSWWEGGWGQMNHSLSNHWHRTGPISLLCTQGPRVQQPAEDLNENSFDIKSLDEWSWWNQCFTTNCRSPCT